MTELVAASDLDMAKRVAFSKKWGVRAVYENYKKMLSSEKIDILSVSTPPDTHWSVIREASRHPLKAIYCEKPIAESLDDANKIVALCKKSSILLFVNHQRRFGLFYQELKQKLIDGTLGTVQQATCYYTRGISNTCTHMIDLFIFLFGDVAGVEACTSLNASPFQNDPNIDGTIYFKSGLALSLKALDDKNYLTLETDIWTTKARIRMGEALEFFRIVSGKNLLNRPELAAAQTPFKAVYPKYGMVSLDRGVEHIARCLRMKEKPVSTGESATQALAVIRAMLDRAKINGKHYAGRGAKR